MTRITNVSVALIVCAAAIGLIGAFGTYLAHSGYLRGPRVHLLPLVPSLAGVVFAAIFASPPLIRRRLRNRFLAERSAASKKAG
jgi:hypothetical protein